MMRAPFQGFRPELLAQMAQAAFRPPGAGGAPAVPGMQVPDDSLSKGLAGLGWGLANWKPVTAVGPQGSGPGGAYTTADAMSMAGMGGNPSDPNYGVPSGLGITPTSWWSRNFGGLF